MPRIPGLTDWPSGAVPDAWDRVALYDWSVDRTYDAPLVALAAYLGTALTPADMAVAASDETTALTTGDGKIYWHTLRAMTVTGVNLGLTTASSSGSVTVDIEAYLSGVWTSLFTALPSLGSGVDWVTAAALAVTALPAGTKMRANVDAAGTGAKGLKVYVLGLTA